MMSILSAHWQYLSFSFDFNARKPDKWQMVLQPWHSQWQECFNLSAPVSELVANPRQSFEISPARWEDQLSACLQLIKLIYQK